MNYNSKAVIIKIIQIIIPFYLYHYIYYAYIIRKTAYLLINCHNTTQIVSEPILIFTYKPTKVKNFSQYIPSYEFVACFDTYAHNLVYILIFIFLEHQRNAYSMNNQPRKRKIRFVKERNNSIAPDIIMKSFWVSTSLALILTIPPLAIFITIFQNGGNLLVGVVIGFGIHFILFSQSVRISSFITSFFDD